MSKPKRILAHDPGNHYTAYTLYLRGRILKTAKVRNDILFNVMARLDYDVCVIEKIGSYGKAVGEEIFNTCIFSGKIERDAEIKGKPVYYVYRKDVKLHLCNSTRTKDSNVRQAIIDRYRPTGGGETPQVGTKKKPGPLFGVANDMWASLAVAITYDECGPSKLKYLGESA